MRQTNLRLKKKMLDNKLFLGIDTSNYTTSVALCDGNGKVLLNLKKLLHVSQGERGLRQSDALFAHTKNLPIIMEELKSFFDVQCDGKEIASVGYSATPRDAEGSYMPCFLAGVANASSISAVTGCRSYALSHQAGHIAAALYSANKLDLLDGDKPFAAFHVSGGTTDILLVKPNGEGFSVEQIGGSADINAGQAIDRTGVLMGLGFPCGREMESLVRAGEYEQSKTRISVNGLECNLSGLENLAAKLYGECGDKGRVSAYCFDFVADTLVRLTENLRAEYENIPIIYAGGVMSNGRIKERLSCFDNVYFSLPEFSSDNAAGVALLGRRKYLSEKN